MSIVTENRQMVPVTVLIVNWNSGGMLARCLDQLGLQTVLPESVLVLDNASTDSSASHFESRAGVLLQNAGSNLGFAAGNNSLLKQCNSAFVALLNPDAFPEANWLECLLDSAVKNPSVTAFGSRQMSQARPDHLDGIGDCYHISGHVWREGFDEKLQSKDLEEREIFSPCAAAAMYRREAVEALGGFDEDFFCYIEDIDLGFRLRLMGHKAMYVPNAVVHHVGSATTGGLHSDFSVYHGHRNLVWTFIKNMPGILFWVLLPLHLLMNIAVLILFSVRGQGSIIFKSKWDALKGIPLAWRKRRLIQTARTASVWEIWQVLNKKLVPGR